MIKGEVMDAPLRDFVQEDSFYATLDPGIRWPVRLLHYRGIETHQSCQGGDQHAYEEPSIDLGAPWAALDVLSANGVRVRRIAHVFNIVDGAPSDHPFWRVTLTATHEDRADEIPMFRYGYRPEPWPDHRQCTVTEYGERCGYGSGHAGECSFETARGEYDPLRRKPEADRAACAGVQTSGWRAGERLLAERRAAWRAQLIDPPEPAS